MSNADVAPILRRLDMMVARGYLIAVDDADGMQTMQVGVLDGEVLDQVERFQTYGISAVPPPGDNTAVLIVDVQGNRDQPVAVALNDSGSRPKGVGPGEVVIYNDQNVSDVARQGWRSAHSGAAHCHRGRRDDRHHRGRSHHAGRARGRDQSVMPRVSLAGLDNAGGGGLIPGRQSSVRCDGALVIVVGDAVASHGVGAHDNAVVAAGSPTTRIGGIPVTRAGDLASCGDPCTGSATLVIGG